MLTKANKGRALELRFMAECVDRGYEVWDAVGPNGPADCLVNGHRIQVKTLQVKGDKIPAFCHMRYRTIRSYSLQDVDFLVTLTDSGWAIMPLSAVAGRRW